MHAKRIIGAMFGGLAAGLGLSVMMLSQEKQSGNPSELTDLERTAADRIGLRTAPAGRLPDTREQAISQGGHLALSALGGAVYAAFTDEDTKVLPSGIAFGLAFYAAAHWIVGPALGLARPEWRADRPTIGMHTATHILFGLATAAGARAASRR